MTEELAYEEADRRFNRRGLQSLLTVPQWLLVALVALVGVARASAITPSLRVEDVLFATAGHGGLFVATVRVLGAAHVRRLQIQPLGEGVRLVGRSVGRPRSTEHPFRFAVATQDANVPARLVIHHDDASDGGWELCLDRATAVVVPRGERE